MGQRGVASKTLAEPVALGTKPTFDCLEASNGASATDFGAVSLFNGKRFAPDDVGPALLDDETLQR